VVKRIALIIFIFLTILFYNLLSLYLFNVKSSKIVSNKKSFSVFVSQNHFQSFKIKIEQKLFNLNYPYNLTTKRYLVIKFVFSPLIFIIAIVNYKTLLIPLLLFISSFFSLDYLIYLYKKEEDTKLIDELKNLTSNLILCLSTYAPLKLAFKNAGKALRYKRFIITFEDFIRDYEMNGYNLNKALKRLEEKFDSYDLSVFTSLLRQGEREGNLIENLERFSETLDLNYFKYLKRQSAKRLLYVTLGTVLSLINIMLVVMYPIIVKVMGNLQSIFS